MPSRRVYSSSLRQLDLAAIAFACMLSVACFAKGAVQDSAIAILLLVSLPILWLALTDARAVHTKLKRICLSVMGFFLVLLLLQYLLPSGLGEASIWHRVEEQTGVKTGDFLLQDKAAWVQGIGRFLFLVIVFALALLVGSAESSARHFLNALLISGAVGLSITFFTATRNGVPTSTVHSYTHGFVNPNNASAYIGIMLLVTLAQAARFFRMPARNFYKTILNFIDGLSMKSITQGVFLAFCLLLTLAGLFMTGSRGGIVVTILAATVFLNMVLVKTNVASHMRKWLILGAAITMAPILLWSFMNFGQVILHKIATNGTSSNARVEVQGATVPMVTDYWFLGTGLGGFSAAFQQYRPDNIPSDGIIEKAHNSYLEFAAEMGIPATLVLLAMLGWFGKQLYTGYRERKERFVIPALGFSVWLLGGIYSLIDFPLQIPGLTALFIAIVVVSVSQTDARFSEPLHSTSGIGITDPTKRVRIRKRRSGSGGPRSIC